MSDTARAEVLRVMLERDADGCHHVIAVADWVRLYDKAGVRSFLWDAADELLAFVEEEFGPHPDDDGDDGARVLKLVPKREEGEDDE